MPSPIHILVVDDDEINCLLEEVSKKHEWKSRTGDRKGMKKTYEVLLTDIKMAGVDGMEVLHSYRQKSPETIVIMMTAFGSIETAIGAIKEGAYDYVSKPFKLDEIKLTIRRALEQKRLTEENLLYRQELISKYKLENIVGRTPAMLQVYKTIARGGRLSTVLLAVSGTGKIGRLGHSPTASGGKTVCRGGSRLVDLWRANFSDMSGGPLPGR
jgi:DNA-binding NtrC family response regulator